MRAGWMEAGSSGPDGPEGGAAGVKDQQVRQSNGRKPGMGGCFPKAPTIPSVQIHSEKVRGTIELWKEKSLIGKFVGIWPKEKDLIKWISSVWNPKGHYDLQLGSKGFFTIIFFNQEDRDQILEGGPYFFFSAGLYL